MNHFSAPVLIPILVVLITACPRAEEPEPDSAAVCLEGASFAARGTVPVDPPATAGDAQEVSALRWEAHEGCERIVIDLAAAEGSPAVSPGTVRAEFLRDLGVVRLSLVDVERVGSGATDAAFDGSLAGAAYVVWSPDGRWMFVDVHLRSEAEAHVTLLESPARVVVDLRPGGGTVPPRPTTSRRVVVLQPRPGDASYPLAVVGYARTFEANVVVRLEQDGEPSHEDFTTATAWVDAWGHFVVTIPDGPRGRLTLHVGEYSARDGTWEGAAVELDMR